MVDREKLHQLMAMTLSSGLRSASDSETVATAILTEIAAQGLVIVPREPTPQMKAAGADNLFGSTQEDWGEEAATIYTAMIEAEREG